MSEENPTNNNIQNSQLSQQEKVPQEIPDILNSDFFKSFEAPKKLPEKKTKISNLINFLKENNTYFQSLKDPKKLLNLYDIITTNLIENNNNFVLAQIDLIEILSEQITNTENNEIKNDFITFYKKSLPKLFDKFYLQNQKINQNLLMIFDNSIKRKILQLKDYYPFIENICIEEDDEYKTNILNFLYEQIKKDENIFIDNIPINIIETIKKSDNNEENENLNEICKKIMDVLNKRKKKEIININTNNENNINDNNDLLNIPSTPLSQQDSKLAFSSFIKKISKAVKQENLNKKINNINNFNILESCDNDVNMNINTDSNNSNTNTNGNKQRNEDILVNTIIKTDSFENNKDNKVENTEGNNEEKDNIIKENNQLLNEEKQIIIEKEINNEQINIEKNNKNETADENNIIRKEEENDKMDENINKNENEIEDKIKEENINNENINITDKNNNFKNEVNNEEINYVVQKEEKREENQIINPNIDNENKPAKVKVHIKRPKSKDIGKNIKKEEKQNEPENKNNNIVSNNDNEEILEKKKSENILENENNQIEQIREKEEQNNETNIKDIDLKKEEINENKENEKKEEKPNKSKDKKENNEKENKKKENSKKEKENANNKKGYKSRITRSRKLGVLAKQNPKEKEKDNNKEKENKNKPKIEENNQKNENNEEKPAKISVNINKSKIKEKDKKKDIKNEIKDNPEIQEKQEKQEIQELTEPKEIVEPKEIIEQKEIFEQKEIKDEIKDSQVNNNKSDINKKSSNKGKLDIKSLKESKKNNNNIKNDFTIEILVKTPDNNKVQIYNEGNPNENNNEIQEKEISIPAKEIKIESIPKNKIEDFDEIPINTNSNILNTNINSEENISNNDEILPKKNTIEEFNKKIELALEQEKQDQLNKENSESNLNKNSKKTDKDDPKFDELKSLLGNEICESLSSPKWEMKKHAFELINNFVNETDENIYNKNDLFEYIKIKLKNFKETNFNIIREAMNIFITMLKKRILSKDNLLLLLNTYYEKMADIKLKDNIIELINTSIEESIIDLSSLISNLISKILKKNNVKILIEYSTLFSKMVEDFDTKDLPIKEMINYCKYMAGNSNPQVRTSATNLICAIYKYVGEDVKVLIKDIKESTLKIIEAELEKVTVIEKKEQNQKKKNIKKKSENFDNVKKKQSGELELISPVDISKKLTSQLLKDLSEGKWIEKKEACETIEKILNDANMKILPNGLNDLFNLIKTKLSDGNKNLVKILISLLNKFIQCLKKEFKPWTKIIALSLIPNLSDKNQAIKNECQLCFEKWVECVGIETLVIYFPQFLKNDNVEIRIEIMKFIKKYNDKFTKNIAENVYKELIDSLLICLQDRSNNVRNEAEDIIKLSLSYVNIDIYYKKAKDFKPAIAKDLKQILDNILENRYLKDDNDYNINENKNLNLYSIDNTNNNISNLNNQLESPTYKNINIKEKLRNSLKMKKSGHINNNTNTNLSNFSNNVEEKVNNYNSDYMSGEDEPEIVKKSSNNLKEKNLGLNSSNIKKRKNANKTAEKEKLKKSSSKLYEPAENNANNKGPLSSNSTVLRSNKKSNNSIEKKPKIQRRNTLTKNSKFKSNVFSSNNIKLPQNKSKRLELDKKFKFTIDTMTKDDINKLKEISKIVFCEDFNNKIFSTDFKKQLEALKKMKNNLDERENISIYFEHLDIILKIIALKLNNVLNPALIKNLFLFLDSLYIILIENEDNKLNEIESNIIICLLIDKLSLTNNQLKDHLLNLINQYIELFDINKSGIVILNYALNKNNKIKSNVLDMIIELYLNKKINIKSKNYIKILSKYLLVNDNIVKSKCITIFREIQEIIKEELWNIKDIGEKERTILENNLFNSEENEEENNDNNNDINNNEDDEEDDNQYNPYDDYNDEENEEENIEDDNKEENYEDNNFNNDESEDNDNNNYDEEDNNNINNNENDNDNFYSDNENKYNNNLNNNEDDKKYDDNEYNNEVLSDNNNNEEFEEDNNEKLYLNNDDIKQKPNNYYIKTDNKVEEKRKNDKYNNQKNQTFYKNNDIISKIQKLQSSNISNKIEKKNNNLKKDKEDIKPPENKFTLPKKIVVKQKKSGNIKKIKNTNANKANNKNMNFNSNNINNNYINNNIINNYYNNNNSMANNNDLSISLYNDMNINNNQNNNLLSNNYSNSTISSEKELLEIMNNLFSEDESEKMNTIIIIHEILCSKYQQNKFILIPNIDNIIKIIIQITHNLFDCIDNLNNKIIPLKFAKYLVTILCKLTSNKELIIHISYKVLYDLCFELLNYLLINGLDKIGSNQEGNIIFKSLNSAMLRVIENCDTTSVILALLEIIRQNRNNVNYNILSNLAVKCLLKTTQNIQNVINNIQIDKLLLPMHLLTYNFDKLSTNNIEQNSQSDIMIIRFIKNIIIEIVKIKKTDIMEDYNKSIKNSQYKDKYIYNWIKSTLESLGCSMPGENENNDLNENNISNNDNEDNNNNVKTTSNNRSTSTNINKNRINNSDKKRENIGFVFDGNKISNNNILNKKSAIIVKKHGNNSINNRYNINSHNVHSGVNNINVTKSSILGSSSISSNNKITIQKNNLKNSQAYKGNVKNKKKYKK